MIGFGIAETLFMALSGSLNKYFNIGAKFAKTDS